MNRLAWDQAGADGVFNEAAAIMNIQFAHQVQLVCLNGLDA